MMSDDGYDNDVIRTLGVSAT